MKRFQFKKIDAFATQSSSGNPAGYIYLNQYEKLSHQEMLLIAQELKGFVNEVGYIKKTGNTHFDLKYYSSEREVDFCGHATIAILYDLISKDPELINTDLIQITTNKGDLEVENRIKNEDAVFICSPKPQKTDKIPSIEALASSLRIKKEDVDTSKPISIINAGLATLLVPIKSLSGIISITPELEQLKLFCLQSKIDIIEVFTHEVKNTANDFRTRVFAPTFGYLEDPATGSGNAALGYYLIENGLWKKETISIEQNGMLDKYNIVKLQKKTDKEGTERVWFGGGAITRIEGSYLLQSTGGNENNNIQSNQP